MIMVESKNISRLTSLSKKDLSLFYRWTKERGVFSKFVYNIKNTEEASDFEITEILDIIIESFYWFLTSEGETYWSELHSEWCSFLRKK